MPEGREDKARKPKPEGREDKVPTTGKAILKVGGAPPEVSAKEWINTDEAPTLAGLKGRVVLVEFWSPTSACARVVPHLNKLHEEYGSKGLTILSFTQDSSRQNRAPSERERR